MKKRARESQPQPQKESWLKRALGKITSTRRQERLPRTRPVYIVRHGDYEQQYGLLTDTGEQQAAAAGLALQELLADQPVHIFHTNYDTQHVRAEQTANILAKHLNVDRPKAQEWAHAGPDDTMRRQFGQLDPASHIIIVGHEYTLRRFDLDQTRSLEQGEIIRLDIPY